MKSLLFFPLLLAVTAAQAQIASSAPPEDIVLKYDPSRKKVYPDTCYWELRADTFPCGWALVADSAGIVRKITPDTLVHTREVRVCRYGGAFIREGFGTARREQFWYRGRPLDLIQYRRRGNLQFVSSY